MMMNVYIFARDAVEEQDWSGSPLYGTEMNTESHIGNEIGCKCHYGCNMAGKFLHRGKNMQK